MPKWLVNKTLMDLSKIDDMHEKGKISKSQHDKKSKEVLEKALAIERNIVIKKYDKENKKILGRYNK